MTVDELLEPLDRRLRIQSLPREELASLLQAVREQAEEALPRSVLADWLEEHGDARAQLLRWSLLPTDDPLAQHTLAQRLKEWWEVFGPSWWGELPAGVQLYAGLRLWQVEVSGRLLADPDLASLGERLARLLAEGWIERVRLTPWPSLAPWAREFLAELPVVQLLDFRDADLAGADALQAVEDLSFAHTQGYLERRRARFTAAGLAHLAGLPHLRKLLLDLPLGVTELPVEPLRNLRELALPGCSELPPETLASLAGLDHLEVLDLQGCDDLVEDGLAHLPPLPGLRVLNLCGCERLPDEALVGLAHCPGLRELSLEECRRISGEGLTHLAALEELQVLRLNRGPHLRDEDLAALGNLRQLRVLEMAGASEFIGNGFAHLAGLSALETLNLGDCFLSEETLPALARLTGLCQLLLPERRFSRSALRQLRAALPGCHIEPR